MAIAKTPGDRGISLVLRTCGAAILRETAPENARSVEDVRSLMVAVRC
jgi:hypothetical protein